VGPVHQAAGRGAIDPHESDRGPLAQP
jgi:hypothetical protein